MQTVTLNIEDGIYDKFTWLLNHFSKKEVEVIEQSKYISDDEYIKSIDGLEQSIINASNEDINKFVTSEKLDW